MALVTENEATHECVIVIVFASGKNVGTRGSTREAFSRFPLSRTITVKTNLSEVELKDIADVMRRVIRQLNQVLPVFKCLAELLHARFGAVHTINSLDRPREKKPKETTKNKS